jgi:hypothetical protein
MLFGNITHSLSTSYILDIQEINFQKRLKLVRTLILLLISCHKLIKFAQKSEVITVLVKLLEKRKPCITFAKE